MKRWVLRSRGLGVRSVTKRTTMRQSHKYVSLHSRIWKKSVPFHEIFVATKSNTIWFYICNKNFGKFRVILKYTSIPWTNIINLIKKFFSWSDLHTHTQLIFWQFSWSWYAIDNWQFTCLHFFTIFKSTLAARKRKFFSLEIE